ncbi:carbohydrate ABC transporter permease [Paenibacillus sacheonensis]|uniref:ABC transporter permease subunit n=1 Tax=Paenibacillus sacheonensis TaxID=742054 RepID=A0A7X4YX65_9BACL|nr:carbohydrate ABC transporter permease [Paenibacillus sacheonensis]MBM7568018.1 putative aldouronate transport system permease protein [Paenibacillus sacheonensis]NBC73224.1 ABC transporter permease subunit [Paenibacillus sacheonensis]
MIQSQKRFNLFVHLFFIVLCAIVVVPFIMILAASFSQELGIIRHGYWIWPRGLSLDAYHLLAKNSQQLIRSYTVTIITTAAGTVLGLWLMTTLGYAISRRDYKYGNGLSFYIFFTMLFRGGLVPSYILVTQWLHMKDTIYALFVPVLVNAFYVLMLKGFLRSIPDALYECAKLDGAGEFTIFTRIVIPLATPAIATVGLLMALQFWNDWFSSLLYTDSPSLLTLQAMLQKMLTNMQFLSVIKPVSMSSGALPQATFRMAVCVVAVGPLLLVFPFFQRFFTKGLTVGAVKG